MSNEMMVLAECAYEGLGVRMFGTQLDPWFALSDVCKILELSNPRMVAKRLDDDEKGVTSAYTLGGKQDILIVSEPGLYTLIFSSKKPEAKNFRRWVTHEVLPQIRKRGRYEPNWTPGRRGRLPDPAVAQRKREETAMLLQTHLDKVLAEEEARKIYTLANGERLNKDQVWRYAWHMGMDSDDAAKSSKRDEAIAFIDSEMKRCGFDTIEDIENMIVSKQRVCEYEGEDEYYVIVVDGKEIEIQR